MSGARETCGRFCCRARERRGQAVDRKKGEENGYHTHKSSSSSSSEFKQVVSSSILVHRLVSISRSKWLQQLASMFLLTTLLATVTFGLPAPNYEPEGEPEMKMKMRAPIELGLQQEHAETLVMTNSSQDNQENEREREAKTTNILSGDKIISPHDELQSVGVVVLNGQQQEQTTMKLPLYMRTIATLACLIIFTIGVCGNLLVPLVVIKTKYLRNSTNLFLINLSIADLLVLIVCMPTVLIELHSRPETWLLGEPMCKLSNFVEMLAANGSIFTILAISFERYYAICKPLKAGYKCTRLRATIIICLIWLLSSILTSPILMMAKSSETIYIDGSLVYNCILETDTYWPKMYVFVSMFAFFCLPLLVLMLVYWLIGRRLIRETIAMSTTTSLAPSDSTCGTGIGTGSGSGNETHTHSGGFGASTRSALASNISLNRKRMGLRKAASLKSISTFFSSLQRHKHSSLADQQDYSVNEFSGRKRPLNGRLVASSDQTGGHCTRTETYLTAANGGRKFPANKTLSLDQQLMPQICANNNNNNSNNNSTTRQANCSDAGPTLVANGAELAKVLNGCGESGGCCCCKLDRNSSIGQTEFEPKEKGEKMSLANQFVHRLFHLKLLPPTTKTLVSNSEHKLIPTNNQCFGRCRASCCCRQSLECHHCPSGQCKRTLAPNSADPSGQRKSMNKANANGLKMNSISELNANSSSDTNAPTTANTTSSELSCTDDPGASSAPFLQTKPQKRANTVEQPEVGQLVAVEVLEAHNEKLLLEINGRRRHEERCGNCESDKKRATRSKFKWTKRASVSSSSANSTRTNSTVLHSESNSLSQRSPALAVASSSPRPIINCAIDTSTIEARPQGAKLSNKKSAHFNMNATTAMEAASCGSNQPAIKFVGAQVSSEQISMSECSSSSPYSSKSSSPDSMFVQQQQHRRQQLQERQPISGEEEDCLIGQLGSLDNNKVYSPFRPRERLISREESLSLTVENETSCELSDQNFEPQMANKSASDCKKIVLLANCDKLHQPLNRNQHEDESDEGVGQGQEDEEEKVEEEEEEENGQGDGRERRVCANNIETGSLASGGRLKRQSLDPVRELGCNSEPHDQHDENNHHHHNRHHHFQFNLQRSGKRRSGSQPVVCSHIHNNGAHLSELLVVQDLSKKQQMDSRRQVVVMLAFVVACFFLLFFPYRVFTIWLILSTEAQVQSLGMETYYNLTYFSRILIYLHSAINPIAYNLISTKFRRAFMSILFCRGSSTRRHFTTDHHRVVNINNHQQISHSNNSNKLATVGHKRCAHLQYQRQQTN